MNYVRHTRAAHEQLSRQPAATPHHVSLYWALFYQWNAARFPTCLDLNHQVTMQAARIGNKSTYTEKLYDLEAWGLLTYQPSQSKHQPSRCFLTVLPVAEVHQVDEPTECSSAPHEVAPSVAEVVPVDSPTSTTSAPDTEELLEAEVQQHSLLGKTSGRYKPLLQNGSDSTAQKDGWSWEDESLLKVEGTDSATVPANGAAEAPKKKVAPKKMRIKHLDEGVKQAAIRAAAQAAADSPKTRRTSSRPQRPEVPFTESELASYEAFAAAFQGTDYALADLRFYHAKISAWRQQGEPPRRRDWRATAIQFFLNDAHDNRLKLAPNVSSYQPGSSGPADAGARPATAGYRSRYDA